MKLGEMNIIWDSKHILKLFFLQVNYFVMFFRFQIFR